MIQYYKTDISEGIQYNKYKCVKRVNVLLILVF